MYLYTSNDPIIEASHGLRFAPFNIGYPKLREHAEAAGLSNTENKWELIFDFSALTGDRTEKFTIIEPADWATELLEIPDYPDSGAPELCFDYPARYGGTLSDEPPQSSAASEPNAFSITDANAP